MLRRLLMLGIGGGLVAVGMVHFAAAQQAPGYVIATVGVDDPEAFANEYAPQVPATIKAAGGKVIVSAKEVEMLEGEREGNLTVVIEFPSVEAARDWYESEAYQATIPARHKATSLNRFMLVPGVAQQ